MALTLDAGALIAADKGDRRFWQIYDRAKVTKRRVTVSSLVVAQAWRGSANIARVLSGCVVEPFSVEQAKAIGLLLGTSATSDIVDAAVALGARGRGDDILTSDREDLERLIQSLGYKCRLIEV